MQREERILQTWCQHFGLDAATVKQPGTTLIPDDGKKGFYWHHLWHVGERIVVQVSPVLQADFEAVLAQKPADYRLQPEDMVAYWGQDKTTVDSEYYHIMEPEKFIHATAAPPFTVRQMQAGEDQALYEDFIAACPVQEAEIADVSVSHKAAFGVLDGEKLVALSSMYVWCGLADIGILTRPDYRGKGLGKAAASATIAHLIPQDYLVFWRNDASNIASGKIALALGFTRLHTRYSVRRLDIPHEED